VVEREDSGGGNAHQKGQDYFRKTFLPRIEPAINWVDTHTSRAGLNPKQIADAIQHSACGTLPISFKAPPEPAVASLRMIMPFINAVASSWNPPKAF